MYHTKTEEEALRIISNSFKGYKIINPFDINKKKLNECRRRCDIMVGMSIGDKYPFIVWNDLMIAKEIGIETYTLIMSEDNAIRPIIEKGIKKEYDNLSYDETKDLYNSIMGNDSKEILSSLFLGKLGRKRSLF